MVQGSSIINIIIVTNLGSRIKVGSTTRDKSIPGRTCNIRIIKTTMFLLMIRIIKMIKHSLMIRMSMMIKHSPIIRIIKMIKHSLMIRIVKMIILLLMIRLRTRPAS